MSETILCESFQKDFKAIVKNFPKAQKRIEQEINSLSENTGDRYPGFGEDIHVRKIRLGLPEYKLSKSDGLRIICLFLITKDKKIPLVIYHKKKAGREQDIKKDIIYRLKQIVSSLDD